MRKRRKIHGKSFTSTQLSPSTNPHTLSITDEDEESPSMVSSLSNARLDSKDEDSSPARLSETTMINNTVPTWTQCRGQV